MRYERFIQYTSKWHRVWIEDHHDKDGLVQWCHAHQSAGGFHLCTEDKIPYRKIEHKTGYTFHFRFESQEDAFLFVLTWCGEDAA